MRVRAGVRVELFTPRPAASTSVGGRRPVRSVLRAEYDTGSSDPGVGCEKLGLQVQPARLSLAALRRGRTAEGVT